MSSRTHLRGILLAAAGAACWSPDGLLLRLVHADGWQILFWRMLSFALALAVVLAWRTHGALPTAFRAMGVPGAVIAGALAATNCFFTFSLLRTTVANALVLFATEPLFGALLGWLLLRQPVPRRTAATIVIGMGGIVAIFANQLAYGSALGDSLAAIAALLFAVNLTLVGKHPTMPLLPPFIVAGLLTAALAVGLSDPLRVPLPDIVILVASGAIQQTTALLLFLSAARALPPAEVGLLGLVETVLGPFWVWLAIGEAPSVATLIAGTIVILALAGHSWLGLRAEGHAPPLAHSPLD